LFAVAAGEWRTYSDSTSSALRIGHLRYTPGPEPVDSVAQYALGRHDIGFSGSSVSQNLKRERTSLRPKMLDGDNHDLFVLNDAELVEV
jgi:hypothetical protein